MSTRPKNVITTTAAKAGCILRLSFALVGTLLFTQVATAQAINQFTVADTAPGGTIADADCGTTTFVSRTVDVPDHMVITDIDFGIYLTHTYRSDLRITLQSPAGTTVAIATNVAGSGDNFNDLFDDEAATAIAAHNATVLDPVITAGATFPYYPISATYPYYSHAFTPTAALSAFDGQDAFGTWTMIVCDSVAQDFGNFKRADLFITSRMSATKTAAVISDGISASNPKAIPGATVEYCVLVTNRGLAATAVTPIDPLPSTESFVPGSITSGTSCAAATTTEDDNNSGADESDPFGVSIAGSTITGSAPTLANGASFAFKFRVTVN